MKKILYPSLFSAILFFSAIDGQAQFLQDNNGTAYRVTPYADVKGTPFYDTNWLPGTVKLKGGNTFKDVSLKFNQYEQVLIFKSKAGVELAFAEPVEEFSMVKEGQLTRFKNLFNGPNSKAGNAFYQVLYAGGTPLYKTVTKDITSTTSYGSSAVDKEFVAVKPAYYTIDSSGKLIKLKQDKKGIESLFSTDKKAKVNEYISKKQPDLKTEKDLIAVFEYGDSL